MHHKERWIFGAIASALAGICSILFLTFFERVEEEIETPSGPAARTNPYLAAERLLIELGLPAESVRGPVHLPPADHVLLMVTPRRTLGRDRTRGLLDWVGKGGHLIISARSPEPAESREEEVSKDEEREADAESDEAGEAPVEDDPDPLLETLGVAVDRPAAGEAEVLELRAGARSRARQVSVAPSPRLDAVDAQPSFAAGPGGGVLARIRQGQGWVTVLSDATFLTNQEIGEHEHAGFLWSLVTTPARPAGVWLVYRDQLPGLRKLLVARAWMALLSGAVLLAAWLWSRGTRFGPLLRPPPTGRRSLREHLEATAEFLWRRGQREALVASERQAVLHSIRRQHPAWTGLSEKERVRYLAELSGVEGGALVRALEGQVGDDPDHLVRMISTLEKVRRSL